MFPYALPPTIAVSMPIPLTPKDIAIYIVNSASYPFRPKSTLIRSTEKWKQNTIQRTCFYISCANFFTKKPGCVQAVRLSRPFPGRHPRLSVSRLPGIWLFLNHGSSLHPSYIVLFKVLNYTFNTLDIHKQWGLNPICG